MSMRWKKLTFLLMVATEVSTIKISEFKPRSKKVKQGETLTLWCKADNWWEWCTIEHEGKECQFIVIYDGSSYKYEKKKCNNGFDDRIEFDKNMEKKWYECGVTLRDVRPEDAGDWSCQMIKYYDWTGEFIKYSKKYYGKPKATMKIEVDTTETKVHKPAEDPTALALVSNSVLTTSTAEPTVFKITDFKPQTQTVKVGDSITLWCRSEDNWEWCTFEHANKKCQFVYDNDYKVSKSKTYCKNFDDRIKFDETLKKNYRDCGITLTDVQPEDAGEWSCKMLKYMYGDDGWSAKSREDYGEPRVTMNVKVSNTEGEPYDPFVPKPAVSYRAFTPAQNQNIFYGLLTFNSLLVSFIVFY